MEQFLLFAILGFGAGAAYGLIGLGVVLIYKGSGVVNFAQGAVAMVAAFCCNDLVNQGLSVYLAAAITVAGAGVAGVVIYVIVMRPLRNASSLSQVIATIGLLVTLVGIAVLAWNDVALRGQLAPSLVPTDPVTLFGSSFGVDRLWLLGIAAVLCVALSVLYRYTNFGLATRAAAESERGASLLGISPDRVAAGNWAIGFGVASIAGILIAPITALNVTALAFIILPALAAAVVGRFTSFGLTVAAGVVIGVSQSLITRYWTLQGMSAAFPLFVVIVALAVTGRRIPVRGTLELKRPPLATDGRIKIFWAVAVPAVVVASLLALNLQARVAITSSMTSAIVALSVVVVTGYVGQVNLAPLSFAAAGAFGVSLLGHGLGIPFPIPILLAAAVTVPIGLLIGLPALRIRGINLAAVPLGAGIVMDVVVFQNYTVSGGTTGRPVPEPSIFGFSLDSSTHPARFGIFVLTVLLLLTVVVCNVRRSGLGRKMLAVRRNERAAAAVGVNVASIKLYAFGLSAAIASIAGGVLAYQAGATSGDRFSTPLSLFAVAVAFIGGVASVSGAYAAGLVSSGGVIYMMATDISGISKYWYTLTGVLLVLTVVTQPDGMAVKNMQISAAITRRFKDARSRPESVSAGQ
jgi:branched-subunit amino acid ABC-type transport system permease component